MTVDVGPAEADLRAAAHVLHDVDATQDEHAFRGAVDQAIKNSNGAVKLILTTLAIALSPMLVPSSRSEPFRPLLVMQGRRSPVPADLTEAELNVLQALIPHLEHETVRARIADILWCCRHEGRGTVGRVAVAAYCAAAKARQSGVDWHEADSLVERALHLAAALGRTASDERMLAENTAIEMAHQARNAGRWAKFQGMQHILRRFHIGDPAQWANECEVTAAAAEVAAGPLQASEILDEAAAWWRRADDEEKAISSCLASVEALVRCAHQTKTTESAIAATHWLELALKKIRTVPAVRRKERELELASLLTEWQQARESELRSASINIDVTEITQKAEAAVTGLQFVPALAAFAMIYRSPPEEKRRRDAEGAIRRHPLQYLVQRIIIDDDGKTVRRLPALSLGDAESHEAVVRHAMIDDANRNQSFIGTSVIEPARYTIASEHPLIDRQFRQIALQSPFVPAGREDWWATALSAGFAGDLPTALHILVPQIEHALRVQVRLNGHPARTMNAAGEQEDWTLSTLLQGEGRERVEAIIGADTVFDLRALLVEKSGQNLRNRMSHGLLQDGSLRDGGAAYLFWICVRLCLLPLISVARSERSASRGSRAPKSRGPARASPSDAAPQPAQKRTRGAGKRPPRP